MKIKKFEVINYRSCKKTIVLMQESLTGLIGINGAGKSNILNAILLLKKITRGRNNPRVNPNDFTNECEVKVDIEYDNKTIYLKILILYSNDERNSDEVQFSRVRWNFKEFNGTSSWIEVPIESIPLQDNVQLSFPFNKESNNQWKTHYQMKTHYQSIYYPYTNQKFISKLPYEILRNVAEFFYGINYYSASQFSDPSRCPVSIELEENRNIRRSLANSTHHQFILDLYRSYKAQNKQYKRYLSIINKEGIGLIGDIKFTEVTLPSSSYVVRAGGNVKQIPSNRLLVVPSFNIDSTTLSPNQLSEGTFKTLALLFYVLTDDSKLLLIEEPEVCIHHGLLSSIISLIKSQSIQKQIIISTHSDFVLEQLIPENIILVSRNQEEGTIAKQLSKAMSKNDYTALRTYLEESGNLGEYWKEGGFSNE
jgi:predicted ATP-dependent endonuclease of OLD family